MTDEELGEILEFMDTCDKFTVRIAQLNTLPRIPKSLQPQVHETAVASNKLAIKLDRICRTACGEVDGQLPEPERFKRARATRNIKRN